MIRDTVRTLSIYLVYSWNGSFSSGETHVIVHLSVSCTRIHDTSSLTHETLLVCPCMTTSPIPSKGSSPCFNYYSSLIDPVHPSLPTRSVSLVLLVTGHPVLSYRSNGPIILSRFLILYSSTRPFPLRDPDPSHEKRVHENMCINRNSLCTYHD